jgi:3-phenylpropionate/cinnamic acid dioxygenase small subunit
MSEQGKGPGSAIETERNVMKFVHRELRLLDARRFEEWADLFAEDGVYWAPVDPDQDSPDTHVSLFFDDRRTMQTRINRLRHPRIHLQTPPSRTVHLASNFEVEEPAADAATVQASCNFIMFEWRATKAQRIFGGSYHYLMLPQADGFSYKIKQKKAVLVNSGDSFPSLAVWF